MGVGYMGDIWEQIRSRGDFRRHNGMHKYILKKYYDPECNGFAKKNANADAFEYADSLRNFVPCYLKLSVNYSVPLCEPEDFSKSHRIQTNRDSVAPSIPPMPLAVRSG